MRESKCIHTKSRHRLENGFEADLLQTQVAVPEQTTPEEHPVQACSVVHDYHTALPWDETITRDHNLHTKHQL